MRAADIETGPQTQESRNGGSHEALLIHWRAIELPISTEVAARSAKLGAIGIDATFKSRLTESVQAETSALLALVTGPAIRDRVVGVLRGFQREIMLTELTGDDREVWRSTLLGGEQMEEAR